MENNFNELQQLWQSKKATSFDLDGLFLSLSQTERKQKTERIAIAIITPITITVLLFVLPILESKLLLFSFLLIAFGMAWVVWLSFGSKLISIENSMSFSNRQYMETQLKKLRQRYRIAAKYMYFYGFVLIVAINVAYFIFLSPLSLGLRWCIHIGVSLLILLLIHISIKMRLKKYDKTLKPLIQQFETLLSQLQ